MRCVTPTSSSSASSTSKACPTCSGSARSTSGRRSRSSSGSTSSSSAAAIRALNTGIELARSLGDNGSRDLLEDILEGEEKHANWIEAQMTLIAQAGEGNYLAQQIKDDE